jgi:hypothetical protein
MTKDKNNGYADPYQDVTDRIIESLPILKKMPVISLPG